MSRRKLNRRQFVAATAASSAVMIAAPYVRGAYAAGKLSMGFWDHWVPGANQASTDLVNEWAAKEKVEVSIDYITSQGKKIELTIAAEAAAKSGHDLIAMPTWWPHAHAELLEPVNDIMGPIIQENGEVNGTVKYLGQSGGKWLAVPACVGSQIKGPCTRIDLMKKHAGIDVQELYPAGSPPKADSWTTETFLKAAEACQKAGVPFGIGLGETTDSVDSAGAFFQAFGAELVNAKGDVTVKTDAVRQALEFYKRLIAALPPDVASWDDASNNKWLVSGKGAMIMNPPSAWAVAKRDAPQIAEQCWTHGFPAGPKGRFAPFLPYFWSVWSFSKNKEAAKSLIVHLSKPASIEKMVVASGGYDLPAYEKLTTLKVWQEQGPPKGTLYHYPNPYNHQTLSIAASPAPPKIAQQIYAQATMTKMCLRYAQGEKMETTLAWAEGECEGFMRS
ncbi:MULTISPECIES: ABC transporter substrate-binding protein [Bradyrhizobium]|jgi:ABC-type glycerol-3-phosphate transport system substrate-binding protein|uniref:Extracellular solute-binding protein n=4 Tax=Bradyrhizobium TaxID=374 RepID=A0ABS5G4L3_9BRAD|nr:MULTISPECIES: extracellular solute-binding protein [Bradyrhizobium]RTL98930.1 MAG: extracellular solute-binding protein [Bradyrhizobiaceae bacterium]ABQ36180.1 carbohydrate ABC transporter substrate-binding protein, CUT1 family [Bradyrhizobium sp. BTAi1]MBR1136236.1 extracellular solute-binding protein [Bradyrhizobium denitrificans]MCL8484928.1 extracellular solute-binding protein [Bradyrhizobium denitrificans]MDU1495738.1 extracellular solute-binding protein [Bradyrhizobium sp.]